MEMRYGREAIVGTIVIIAIVAFVLGTMWLSGRSIGDRQLVRVRFSNVGGLKRASPVRISGVQVGRVDQRVAQDQTQDRRLCPDLGGGVCGGLHSGI
jgi:ABC-type transporter Mla subunit MlaD